MNALRDITGVTPIRDAGPTSDEILGNIAQMIVALRDVMARERAELEAQDQCILDRLHELTDQGPQWMTAIEAAEYLRVSKPTLYQYIHQGQITRFGTEGRALFKRDDLDAFVERTGRNAS